MVDADCIRSPWYRARYIRDLEYQRADPRLLEWLKPAVILYRELLLPVVFSDVRRTSVRMACAMRGRDLSSHQWGVLGSVGLDLARRRGVHVGWGDDVPWLWELDEDVPDLD